MAVDAHLPRMTVATDDPEEGHHFLRQLYAAHGVRLGGSDEAFSFRADALALDDVSVGSVQYSAAASIDARQGLPVTTVLQLRSTRLQLEVGHRTVRVSGGGDAVMLTPGTAFRADWHSYDASVVVLDDDALARDAAPLLDGAPVAFDFGSMRSPTAALHWGRTTGFVRATAAALDRAGSATPLALRNLTALLNSAALLCFPNSTDGAAEPWPGASRPAEEPAAVRRAKAFIDSHLDQPIDVAGIAAAARTSPRTLQQAFQRHAGITPMQYVRQARLAHARDDLLAAPPGTTVQQVATRWGWTNAGRFAHAYFDAYGRYPSHDLLP